MNFYENYTYISEINVIEIQICLLRTKKLRWNFKLQKQIILRIEKLTNDIILPNLGSK